MALGVVIQVDGFDPVAGAAVSLRAASHDVPEVCHVDGGATFWPAIAKLPKLGYDLFDGSFEGRIAAPNATIELATEVWPSLGRYALADARFQLWTGEVGTSWGAWKQRVDARVTQQPAIADGRANVTFAPDDRWLDRALLSLYAGTTGIEGPAALKGQVKPIALGAPRYVPGVLVDPVNSVFQVSGYGAINGVEAALERLARFGPSAGDYATYAALVAAAIPPGRWATCNASGLVRFGAPPSGQVSFLVQGDVAGPNGWARRPGTLIRRLALLSGGAGKVDDARLDALDAARPYNLSLYLDQQTTGRDLIQELAASVNAVAGVSWMGKLFVLPVAIGTPAVTLATDGSSLPPCAPASQLEMAAPFAKLAITAERTWMVHALGDVAFTAELVDMGAYAAGTTYREGNIVQFAGASWLYVNPTPASGNSPPDAPSESNAYWKVLARAGEDGANGTPFPMVARGAGYIDGNRIGKSGGSPTWGGGDVYSSQSFRGGAFMSYRPAQVGNGVFGALTLNPTTDMSYGDFTASWHCSGDGTCAAYVGGDFLKGAGAYTTSTSLVLTYDGQRFRWYKDGTEVFSMAAPPDLALYFDSAFYEPGAAIKDVAFGPMPSASGGTLNLIPLTAQTSVQGSSVAGLPPDGGWGTAAAVSRESYNGGCSATFTLRAGGGQNVMVGLSQAGPTNADAGFTGITFALHHAHNGAVAAYILGNLHASGPNIGTLAAAGKVDFDGRYVRWSINGEVFATYDWMGTIYDPNAPENKLFFRSALASASPRLDNIVFVPRGTVGKNGVDGLPGDKGKDGQTWYPYFAYANSPDGQVDFTTGEPGDRAYVGTATGTSPTEPDIVGLYSWSEYKGPPFGLSTRGGAVVAGNQVLRQVGAGWDADAFSTVGYRNGAAASFQFSSSEAIAMAGLNTDPTADASYSSIDFAWYARSDGICEIYENGGAYGTFGAYDSTTKFSVAYDGKAVRYFKNGVEQRLVAVAANNLFYFDSSLYANGCRITNIAFVPNGTAGNDGANGVSPLAVTASPSSFQVACDYNGNPKAGSLPIVVNLPAKLGGNPVALSGLSLTTSQCTASVNTDSGNPTGFTITAISGDATIAWSAQSSGQSASGSVTGSKILDGPPPTAVKQNFSNYTGFNVTSYPSTGPVASITIPNSGSVTAFGYMSYRGGAGHTKRAKLQYRVNNGTWTDISGSEVNGTETEQYTEDTVPPKQVNLPGDLQSEPGPLTGLPAGGTLDVRMLAYTTENGGQNNTTNNGYLQLTGN